MMQKNLKILLQQAKEKISVLDTEILAQEIFQISRTQIFTQEEKKFPENIQEKFLDAVEQRKSGKSVSEILGKKNFFGRDFFVTTDVLTPRAETEILVELVITNYEFRISNGEKISRILDIGTGSGAIGITLAVEFFNNFKLQTSKFLLTDISEKALEVAKKNFENIKNSEMTEPSIEFRESNLLEKISDEEIKNSIIVTNLPYIPQKDSEWMEKEVLEGDPHLALFSGEKGVDLYKKFFKDVPDTFAAVFFEYDPPQTQFFKKFLSEKFPQRTIQFFDDLNGDTRFGRIE